MPILQKILTWSQGLPAWQSDAIARLFINETLSDSDMDDLFALLKTEHGIEDPKGRKAKKLTADQIPVVATPNTKVKLVAMKNLQHVNAIAGNIRLPFAPEGLTVIYGDNGSGKSGYSRVLKRACRARDQKEPIHPNAFLPTNHAGNAEATFEIMVNGVSDEVIWINGKPAPELLSTLAVFDSRCARSYLDDEGDFDFVPYGLDIIEGLAIVCKRLKLMIESEFAQSAADKTMFADLAGDTAVGRLINGLSHKTKPEQIETLAIVSAEESAKRDVLHNSLKEANPKEKATQLRLRVSRIMKVTQSVTEKLAVVNVAVVTKLRKLVEENDSAQAAVVLAAQKFKEDTSLLPGTGSDAWKELFEAARKFSVEAYPGRIFPDLELGSQCPLCQQPLAEGAERLHRFEEFVQEETEKVAKARKKDLDDENKDFSAKTVLLGIDDELFSELLSLDKELASDSRAFEKALSIRYEAIKAAVISRNWDHIENLPVSPHERLQALIGKLNLEIESLEKMGDDTERAILQAQFNELEARIRLANVKSSVLFAVERLDRQAKLTKCLSAVKTNAISIKATELTEEVVSKALEEALNLEYKNLGVGNLQVCLKSRTDKGKAFHKLKLNLPQTKIPGDILSEGEQRAIAIGSFLAEISIGGSSGGIVFDDPTSSLDHKRRERISRRLAQEGAKRQVIIFTHDIYFLNLLVEEALKAGIPVETQSITRRPEGFGISVPDLPFEGMNTKSRVGYLRNQQQGIKKVYQSGDELEHRKLTAEAYRQLRIAWERAVEEVLLRNVVLRFRKGIETQRLSGVQVLDSDYATVDLWMSKCSNYAHDQALLGGVEVPDPDELLADINSLETWRLEIHERGDKTHKIRKSA